MKTKKRSFPILLSIIILISVIYGAVTISRSISVRNQKMDIIAENKERIKTLEKDIKELNAEIENSDSTAFIEKVAREDLGMVKPREVIYIDKNKEKDLPSEEK
ncbi:MAG: septum formation initiator family protein [Tissierellia bacterium]|nr:septum formation initiator family protein [Tissierellia bacterium]